MSAFLLGFPPRDLAGKIRQLLAVDDFAVHHPDEQFLDGAAVKIVEYPANRPGCNIGFGFDSRIDIGPALDTVPDVAFVLKPLENRAGRRFLHEVLLLERHADTFSRGWPALPQGVHDQMLEITEILFSAKHCSATNCSG